jgi:hypothetical protein
MEPGLVSAYIVYMCSSAISTSRGGGVRQQGLSCVPRKTHGKYLCLLCARLKTHDKKARNRALMFVVRLSENARQRWA